MLNHCKHFYASVHPIDGAGGIMFSVHPSISAYTRTYMHVWVVAFFDWLAIDF